MCIRDRALPHEPLEAARVDGANWWQTLKWVTLPLLAPVLLVSILIRSMECLRNFDMIFNFFGGGPGNATETVSYTHLDVYKRQGYRGYPQDPWLRRAE